MGEAQCAASAALQVLGGGTATIFARSARRMRRSVSDDIITAAMLSAADAGAGRFADLAAAAAATTAAAVAVSALVDLVAVRPVASEQISRV